MKMHTIKNIRDPALVTKQRSKRMTKKNIKITPRVTD